MTRSLIFYAANSEMAKQIVNFWNPYCIGVIRGTFNGSAEVYAITYNNDSHKIENYEAFSKESCSKEGKQYMTIPSFMTFPKEVQSKMIELSRDKSPIPFIENIAVSEYGGGFDWDKTEQGWNFWHEVIELEHFDLFYNKFKIKDYEGKLCDEDSPFRGDSDGNSSSIRSRFNKARITVQPLSYQKVIGRG